MRTIQLNYRKIDQNLKNRSALEEDCSVEISEPCVCMDGDEIKIIYSTLDNPPLDLEWAFKTLEYKESTRTSGLKTRSRIFGFSPRNPLRTNYCNQTSLAREQPKQHEIILKYARVFSEIYKKTAPEKHSRQMDLMSRVKDFWKIKDSVFTSGIVNKNNPLKYHYDAGNFHDCFSCMVVMKKDTLGGHLAIPEYDIKFNFKNYSFIMFDGQSLLHGVTPIKKLNSKAFRYSAVWYALEQMKCCGSPEEELKHLRNSKTLTAQKKAKAT